MTETPLPPPTTIVTDPEGARRAEVLQAQIFTLSAILRMTLEGLAPKSDRERREFLERIRTETSREIPRFAKDTTTILIATDLMNATVPRR